MFDPNQSLSVYGLGNRYQWIKSHLSLSAIIVDIGCGTGASVTLPLLKEGYDVYGFDLCKKSIALGNKNAHSFGVKENRFFCLDFTKSTISPHYVILNQILEHLTNDDLDALIKSIYMRMPLGSKLLVTVPHGYGWYEIDDFLYTKCRFKTVLEKLKLESAIIIVKNKLLGFNTVSNDIATFDCSAHVQKFTFTSLPSRLEKYGFALVEKQGGVFLCGPIFDTLFTGFKSVLKVNIWLAKKLPWISSDLYFCFEKK